MFNDREARRALRAFRRKGLDSTAGPMIGALARRGLDGATVLEIGAGVGSAQVALVSSGASRSVAYDLSPAYEQVSAELLREHGFADRVEWHTGDFVAEADGVAEADVVFLNRVVCCYPHMTDLLGAATKKARRMLAFSYPRDRWWLRFWIRLVNGLLWLRRTSFRAFVHDPGAMAGLVSAGGFVEVDSGRTLAWEWKVWQRPDSSAPGSG